MDSRQEAKLSMYIVVRDYLAKFLTILNVLPNFTTFYTALQNVIKQIQSTGEAQGFDTSGNAENKSLLKDALINLAVDTTRKVKAYAKFVKNQVLLKEMDIPESKLKRMADTTLVNVVQGIYDRAQSNITALTTYLVTEATQTALQAAITDFSEAIGQPRLGSTETSKATKRLILQFQDGDAALKDIDTVVEIISATQVDFYNGYKSVRKQTRNTSRTLAIKGLVTDAATGEGLKNAKVTFSLNGSVNGKNVFTKKTAEKGGFLVRTAPEGAYDVTAELLGYKKGNAEVIVIPGQMSTVYIALEKA
ncbi:MAG TPA: carboxypeptidase-like regulatory domain-containing protein [Bacteroidales bacterium]|nr:carboxypeptidase-like regulatory domain-containing protein [Bacteroidales bacterium]